VFVGTATNAHWPKDCPVYRSSEETTAWKETPVPSGPVEQNIIDEANEDLDRFASELEEHNVTVYRPKDLDFQSFDGMYNYCPRDRLLVIDDIVIDAPMVYPTRIPEIEAYREYINNEIITCDDPEAKFDAANVCRLGRGKLLYLVSSSGNYAGGKWLQKVLGNKYEVEIVDNIYSGVHIDSTIVPIDDGLVMINAERVKSGNIPRLIKDWKHIKIHENDIVPTRFHNYPYASNYIALNLLSLSPNKVICDPRQLHIRDKLEAHGIETIGVHLRHSRTLGGGHHCTTLDIYRT
jgi:N-dimethylarginine dimethylaminohydrolase